MFPRISLLHPFLLNSTGSEKTAGKVDVKEGIYFGPDVSFDDPDVISGTPMVGPNQYPDERDLPNFANAVTQYRDQMKTVGCVHTYLLSYANIHLRNEWCLGTSWYRQKKCFCLLLISKILYLALS